MFPATFRDGVRFGVDDLPVEETYGLVVARAGISGLSGAWFYRERRPDIARPASFWIPETLEFASSSGLGRGWRPSAASRKGGGSR